MTHSTSYQEQYKLLNIEAGCDWETLRKSYRSLILKWHPDRFTDESEKELATSKIKDFNLAYKMLADYYRKHGTLPDIQINPTGAEEVVPASSATVNRTTSQHKPDVKNDDKPEKEFRKSSPRRSPTKPRKQKIWGYVAVIVLSIIILTYFDSPQTKSTQRALSPATNSASAKTEATQDEVKTSAFENDTKKKIKAKEEKRKTKYFTYGSTIGEVILIQGPPDRMEGEVWYYGESEVHFKDGIVKYWVRTPNSPIKAQL